MTDDLELARLAALRELDAVGVKSDERFSLMAETARRMFDVPMVSITLIDAAQQWRVAWCGAGLTQEAPLDDALCAIAMRSDDELFLVPDTLEHPTLRTNRWVIGPPALRFYAGFPLAAPNGVRVGTFCVMDIKPRHFSAGELQIMVDLGKWVQKELHAGVRAVDENVVSLTG